MKARGWLIGLMLILGCSDSLTNPPIEGQEILGRWTITNVTVVDQNFHQIVLGEHTYRYDIITVLGQVTTQETGTWRYIEPGYLELFIGLNKTPVRYVITGNHMTWYEWGRYFDLIQQ